MDKYFKKVSTGKKSPQKALEKAFYDFDTFKNGLGTWKKPLNSFVTSKQFGDIYTFIKEKYEGKTPCYPPKELIFNVF